MTNHWRDFKNSDVILVIGANPAENHPCGWKWAHVGRDERGTKIIHVDPRFTRTSAIADLYAPIRAGTDVAFFGGLINYILEHKRYDEAKRTYDPTTWDYDRLPPVVPTAATPPSSQPSSGGSPALGNPAGGAT